MWEVDPLWAKSYCVMAPRVVILSTNYFVMRCIFLCALYTFIATGPSTRRVSEWGEVKMITISLLFLVLNNWVWHYPALIYYFSLTVVLRVRLRKSPSYKYWSLLKMTLFAPLWTMYLLHTIQRQIHTTKHSYTSGWSFIVLNTQNWQCCCPNQAIKEYTTISTIWWSGASINWDLLSRSR